MLRTLPLALAFVSACYQNDFTRDAASDAMDAAAIDSAADRTTPPTDGSTTSDGGPITAPDEQWTWIPMDDVICGNGSSSGIGVNLTHRSGDVLVVIQGGGACWDVNTCFVIHAASNIDTPYQQPQFDSDVAAGGNVLVFDRASTENPFRNANYIFVPYCTGDLHAGDRVVTYSALGQMRDVHHVGSRNMRAILSRLQQTFTNPRRVWWTGFSAGGYGATLNWERARDAFPTARVDLLSDCGDPITPANHWHEWISTWSMQLPPGCTDCSTNLTAVVDHAVATAPMARYAWLAYQQDGVLSAFYGISGAEMQTLTTQTQTYADTQSAWRYFILPGTRHVMLGDARTLVAADGQTLRGFMNAWANDDPTWHSSHP